MSTVPLPTALVINDDLAQLHLMAALLEKEGLAVVACQSAEDALRLLDTPRSVDVIVTDLHMPGIDGWRFCRLLRSPHYAAFNTVPVLVVSATFAGTDIEEVPAELGANAFLPVPYDAGTFRALIRHLLAGRLPPASLRVVIVEPSPIQQAILQRAFAAQGYTVALAETGAAGQRLLREHAPEIVVLDYYLPDMTGEQLLREFVRPASAMVAVVMTTDPSPELALHCLQLGADAYVHRPFAPPYLLDLCAKGRRSRALLRVETLLEERTQKLRASEAKFRLLCESIPDAVLVHDLQGRLRYVNGVGAAWLGWPTEELLGTPRSALVTEPEGPQDSVPFPHGPGPSPGRSTRVYRSRTGHRLEAEVHTCSMEFEGQPALLDVVRDITARTRLEAQLRQAQKMQAIGTLAGGIAHDFNNILTAVLGYTELALDDGPHGSRVQRYLEEVLTAGKRARDLVQHILAFSRQRPAERQPVRLHLLINDVLRMLRASLPSTITIESHLTPAAGTVLADPTQLQQVLMNLCTNAEHAMRAAGGTLDVRLDAVEVGADFAAAHAPLLPGPHVCLRVRDTGCGIPQDVVERIFEPFFTTKAVGEGTGMGLAVVNGIIANHGGVITVTSTPGQGTTCVIYLPCLATPMAPPEVPAPPPLPSGQGHILCVDDEPTLVHLTTEMLRRLGYEVTGHTSGVEALQTFRATPWHFDLVLTDQTMPALTGEGLARELRRIRSAIPIILCTGGSATMTARTAQTLEIDAVLTKPLEFRALGRVIQHVIAQRRACAAAAAVAVPHSV